MKGMKKVVSLLAAICMVGMTIFGSGLTMQVSAEEAAEVNDADKEYQKTVERVLNMDVATNDIAGWPKGPKTHGEAAIVMEVGTGTILYSKNIDAAYYPASITKLLTALVALEHSDLTDKVKLTDECVDFLNWDDAWIGLKSGDTITMEEAMHAMLMASANEASYAIALNVGESNGHDYNWFIEQMNQKMKEIGGTNSNFVNANGLHDENHYTTARDMALVGKALFAYPDFFRISQTQNYVIKKTKHVEEHVFQQYHKMLLPYEDDYYPYAIGGKLGYTDQALSTLVTMTEKDEMQLVTVVLKTYGANIYPDTRNLSEYGFNNFQKLVVTDQEPTKDIDGFVDDEEHPGYVVVPSGVELSDLEEKLTPIDPNLQESHEAILSYTYNGHEVGSARVKLSDRYVAVHKKKTEESQTTTIVETNKDKKSAIGTMSKILVPVVKELMVNQTLQILVVVFFLLIALMILLLKFRAWRRQKRREKLRREKKIRAQKLREKQLREKREAEEKIYRRKREQMKRMKMAGLSDEEIEEEMKIEDELLREKEARETEKQKKEQ